MANVPIRGTTCSDDNLARYYEKSDILLRGTLKEILLL